MFAGDVRLDGGVLRIGENRFQVRGVSYSLAEPPCAYARDLPLLAAMGANTVRTYGLLPGTDTTFVPLLETAGLRWLAEFPLEPYYDRYRPISAQREEILAAFRRYALRFGGEQRLAAFVFGNTVVDNYNLKFAGPVSDYYALLEDAAAILRDLWPENPPLLAASTRNLAELRNSPAGLSFWLYDADAIGQVRQTGSKPVLLGELTRETEVETSLLGGVHAALTGDREVFGALAAIWGGRPPAAWLLEREPRLEKVAHAASEAAVVAPGTLVRVTGKALEGAEFVANGIPWPLHQGQTCLCVGERPVPLGMVSGETAVAQIPWDLPPGEHTAVLYRAGVASNSAKVQVAEFAPGIFPEGVVRAGTFCRASTPNGVRPGEILEVYASGLGPGAPSWNTPVALINGTPAEVLYSGALPNLVGMNQVNLRVNPLTPPAAAASLELRVADAASNLYPLSVSGAEERFGIRLDAPATELVLQAGGPARVVDVAVEGVNGYCGPVLFASTDSPSGVTFRAPVGYAGQTARLEWHASAASPRRSGAKMVLYGYAAGATSGSKSISITVLPGLGEVRVLAVSGGYKARSYARFDWEGRNLFTTAGDVPGRGINVLAIEAATGIFSRVESFDTWGDPGAAGRLIQYLSALPEGTVVMFAVADEATLQLTVQARSIIAAMFGSRSIRGLAYQQSWAMIARKGAATPIAEAASTLNQVLLEPILKFPQP